MTISEFIKELERIRDKHGDLKIINDRTGYSDYEHIRPYLSVCIAEEDINVHVLEHTTSGASHLILSI